MFIPSTLSGGGVFVCRWHQCGSANASLSTITRKKKKRVVKYLWLISRYRLFDECCHMSEHH